jgi:hypothetical protein
MSTRSTPTGDRARAVVRKIDRWILKQEDECTLDWDYIDRVKELEELFVQMQGLDRERKQLDREEAMDREAREKEA